MTDRLDSAMAKLFCPVCRPNATRTRIDL